MNSEGYATLVGRSRIAATSHMMANVLLQLHSITIIEMNCRFTMPS
jgi:hypothetical protein